MNDWDINPNWEQGFSGVPGAIPPWSSTPPMPPFFSESRRDICQPMTPQTESHNRFVFDSFSSCWCIDSFTNGRPSKRKSLVQGLLVTAVINVIDAVSGQLRYLLVRYNSPEEQLAVIPVCDHLNRRYWRHFSGLCIFPKIAHRLIDELLWYIIRSTPTTTMTLFPHHGFMPTETGKLVFAYAPTIPNFPAVIMPVSLRIRRLEQYLEREAAVKECSKLFNTHPKLALLGLLLVGSLLLYFLLPEGLYPDFQVILLPSAGVTDAQLTAILSLLDERYIPIPSLESNEKTVRAYLGNIYDGIALFHDYSMADEGREIEGTLRLLVKQSNSAGGNSAGRNIIAIISRYAAYTARCLPAAKLLAFDFEDVTLKTDCSSLHRLVKSLEAVVVTAIQSRADEVVRYIGRQIQTYRSQESKADYSVNGCRTALNMLCIAAGFLEGFLDLKTLSSEGILNLLKSIDRQGDLIQTADQAIISEWSEILSSRIRNGNYTVLRKRRGMRIDPSQKIVFVDGNRLQISDVILEDTLSEVNATDNHRSLIRALKANDLINATDGDTHPYQTHDLDGESLRLYLYDIDAEILDDDVLHAMKNPDSAEFWIHSASVPQLDFAPLLTDGAGLIAGQRICWHDVENAHILVTGQSGAGKTFWLCQRAGQCSALGHWSIIFDGNDFFPHEDLCQNLPKRFVDEHFSFHDIESRGIPVNIFSVDRSIRKGTQVNILHGILTAGIGELSTSQSNAMKTALRNLIDLLDEGETIRPDDILAMLDEEGATYESLRSRIEPLFEEIAEYGMKDSGWSDVLSQGTVLVLRTDPSFAAKGNQLFDMIFASLYNFKRQHKETPLDLIVDEAQNQNFAENSPLRKLLKEGRSSRLSVCIATQDFYGRNTELGSAVGKVGTQVFFRPTQNSKKAVAEELNLRKEETEALDSMLRGEAIMKGSFYNTRQNRNNPATLRGKVCCFEEKSTSISNHITDEPESQDIPGTGGTDDETEQ